MECKKQKHVFIIVNKYNGFIYGCFKTKKGAENYILGNINYEIVKLKVIQL